MSDQFPKTISLPDNPHLVGSKPISLSFDDGLCALVGPNGAGKSEALKRLRDYLRQNHKLLFSRMVVYLSSGRSGLLEQYRAALGQGSPGYIQPDPAAVGHQGWVNNWWEFEGTTGMFLRLKSRPDLLIKVEARLQALFQRRLRLEWSQHGLQVGFTPIDGSSAYWANAEASGVLEIVPLLAAIYDDEIGALLIDEPEISLHPQLQSFLLQEIEEFSGFPDQRTKKLVVIATHSPSMLPLRKIGHIPRLAFFTNRTHPPVQLTEDAGELKSTKLSALIIRLTENHKLAFFARNVLLVEGPSDELVVSGIALALSHPLLGSNTQVVPVTGKGQFGETVKLFRMMGKKVFVMADLDGLVDDNQLVNQFREAAQSAANARGMGSITEIDRSIRDRLDTLIDKANAFETLSPAAANHHYWLERKKEGDEELKAKRRAVVAALFTSAELADELLALRTRYETLIEDLASAGCVILRRGSIEDYYFDQSSSAVGKPEAAAAEMEKITNHSVEDIRKRYDDVVRAIEISAPARSIDENEILREQLGSLLGAALQVVRVGMSDEELNGRIAAVVGAPAPLFQLLNITMEKPDGGVLRRLKVSTKSTLFQRDSFPFEIGEHENLTLVVQQKLPSS